MDSPADREKQKLLDTREKSQVEPIPKSVEFFEWLEKIFYGPSEFPEKIETRVVRGKDFEQLGSIIKQIIFDAKSPKPSKERLVSISNELWFLMQRDCDIQRKSVVYGVHVAHFVRDADFYERFLQRFHPTSRYSRDGLPRADDDEESMESRFSVQALQHTERMFQLYGGGFEGLLDRFDRVLERSETRIGKLEDKNEKLMDMIERALSLEEERHEKREWNQLKIRSVEKVLDMGLSLAPPILNSLTNKPLLPLGETPEVITLKNFFKKERDGGRLSETQAAVAFGTDDGKAGVLTLDQTKILWEVAHGQVSADNLDQLLPGGTHQITQDQMLSLMRVFSVEQLAPIHLIFQARMEKRQKAATPSN